MISRLVNNSESWFSGHHNLRKVNVIAIDVDALNNPAKRVIQKSVRMWTCNAFCCDSEVNRSIGITRVHQQRVRVLSAIDES